VYGFFAAAGLAVVSLVLYFVLTVITPPHLVGGPQPAVMAQPAQGTELPAPAYYQPYQQPLMKSPPEASPTPIRV
jgi:hypothetical protein